MVWGALGGGFGFLKGDLNVLKERKPCQIDKIGLFKERLIDALKYFFQWYRTCHSLVLHSILQK